MRRFTPTLVVLMACLFAGNAARISAAEVTWSTDVQSAWQTAQQANRPLLLYVTSDHCPFCRKMQSETLANPTVARRLRDSYVPVAVSADRSAAIAAQFKVTGVPTTLVIYPDGRIADRMEGYVSPQRFDARLQSLVTQLSSR